MQWDVEIKFVKHLHFSKMLWGWEGPPKSKYRHPYDAYKMQNCAMPVISYVYHDKVLSFMTLHIIYKGRCGGYILGKKKIKYFPSGVLYTCVCTHTHKQLSMGICLQVNMCVHICGGQRSTSGCLFPSFSTCFCY